jgi:hypothetical protein
MTDSKPIICGTHGETPATFLCRHLFEGVACGFHADGSDDERPDAWCDLCDDRLEAAGGAWDEVPAGVADIRALCTYCYDLARQANRRVPPLARGRATRLTDDEQAALIHHAFHETEAAQAASDARWGWRAMPRWDFDADAGLMRFSDPARPPVLADVRLVGSYSTRSGTFQWAWKTCGDRVAEAAAVARLRTFGEVRGIAKLTEPNWAADETDGWEMTTLAAYLLGAEGVYRAPFDHVRWYMLLGNMRGAS